MVTRPGKDEGYIVVETLFSFTMLLMVMVVITSLINIVAVQARIHYAITQTAQEMSMFAYVTRCLSEDEEEDDASLYSGGLAWVSSAQGALSTLSHGITDLSNSIAAGVTGFFIDDYAARLMRSFAAAAGPDESQLIMESAVRETFIKYLAQDLNQAETQADAYLIKAGVYSPDQSVQGLAGIDFVGADGTASTMLDAQGDTVVVAAYKIEFNLFQMLPLPLYLDVEQTVRTKAWLGGITQK